VRSFVGDGKHDIRDYDILHSDPDVSWQTEDDAICRAATAFAELGVPIEVRNQTRVHLWYEEKFGSPYPPLSCATDGIDRFLHRNAQVGIRPGSTGFDVYAPHGFQDIARMRVRPNLTPNFQSERYAGKATRWKALWPHLIIEPA
jgi:hypothetical protein